MEDGRSCASARRIGEGKLAEVRARRHAASYTAAVLRRLLSLILCACLALQGATVALATEAPCPMEAEMAALVLAGELDPADLPDCCNDMQAWAETGQLCKTGADCQGLAAWALASAGRGVGAAPSSDAPGTLNIPAPTAPPDAPWRPPTAG